ncbi:SDR family NAD(P)-dependent oxidoreductase [Nocardia grenadensis]|uniref:SDR family NAD(P)-dependent oxidoreductase n=1 Tax=Nocardia grenadensis TaxID=931537 RepID=UPI0007A502DB|nr:SDR family NAD(P)-dependent oxidoreductase [Nocardia grenadensis]
MIRTVDALLDRTIVPGYTRLGYHLRKVSWTRDDPATDALRGRTVLVTGANSGIGKSIATRFAGLGARTVLAVRDAGRGERARREIRDAVPGAQVELEICDIAEPGSIDACARALHARHEALDVLVHNAGVLPGDRTENSAGHELTLATHVLGPLRLTDRLAPLLAGSGDARVIFVASGGMYTQPLPFRDPQYRHGAYRGATAYARTKRMQVAFGPLLDGRLADHGVSVHSMHPGWVATPGITAALPRFSSALRPAMRTAAEGADTAVWLATTTPAPLSGHFWHDRRIRDEHYLRHTRYTEGHLLSLWEYCLDAAEVPLHPSCRPPARRPGRWHGGR